jgi:2'-5' RNA ligase
MTALDTMRLFAAVFPPAEVAQRFAGAARGVARGFSANAVAWSRPEQIHLTLAFLGGVPRAKVGEFERALDEACRRGQRHLLQACGLGCFPAPARARVLWAGLDGDLAALDGLKRALDENLAGLGYAPDKRPFHPHLTLGRVKQWTAGDGRHLAAALPAGRQTEFGPCMVERVELMQSVLLPAGAQYTLVRSFPLWGRE